MVKPHAVIAAADAEKASAPSKVISFDANISISQRMKIRWKTADHIGKIRACMPEVHTSIFQMVLGGVHTPSYIRKSILTLLVTQVG
ncbi:hypothetical protein, partial [Burkholderia ubonensis]|uniref:hypothetical protein n=1 Tax=Burkholderia ubonensis TaxID=101571 RepID=UPI001C435E59